MPTTTADLDADALLLARALGEHGSITAAATALGTSQPAVSQALRRLERRLGVALVERLPRGVRLTEAGAVLARHAVAVDAALDAARQDVAALAGLRAGRVRLVAFPSSSATVVPRALALLRERAPGVQVTFTEAEPPESLDALREGACVLAVAFTYGDVDLGRGQTDLAGLETVPLLEDPLHLALPAGHRLAARRGVRLEELADEQWIAGCPRCRGHLLDLCTVAGFVPEVAYATDDYVAVLGLVAAGLGVALIPGLVLRTAHHHDVVTVAVRPRSWRDVQAVTTPDLLRVPAVAAMLAALRSASQEEPGRTATA